MDQLQWRCIYRSIQKAARSLPRERRLTFSDTLIVAMYVWAVKHDRAMMWACDRRNYTWLFRPRKLPSVSQFHRRVRSERVRQILQRVNDDLAGSSLATDVMMIDGKALLVSGVSKDPDARCGYACGGLMGKGYKLHAYVTQDERFLCWCVRPLNEHEMPIATYMLGHLPPMSQRSLILADGNYDAHSYHKAVDASDAKLVAHLRGQAGHAVTLRQMGPSRRELLELNRTKKPLVRMVLRERDIIERSFAHLTSYGGGLGPLPAFVRRLSRVTRWVGTKIALYHARRKVRLSMGVKQN